MRKVYECAVVGFAQAGLTSHVLDQVAADDLLALQPEPSIPDDPEAVAAFHEGRKIGYLRSRDAWLGRYIEQAERCEARVDGLFLNEEGELTAVDVIVELDLPDPPEPPQSVINQIGEELRLLMTVAMADGSFHAKERKMLERFADVRAREVGLTPEAGEPERAVRWASRNVPDSFETAQIIGRLAIDRPGAFDAILDVADIAAEMDGKVVDQEKAKVAILRELIEIGRQHVSGD